MHMLYDTKLILEWIHEKTMPLEDVAMFAVGLAKERTKELQKEDAWVNPCCDKETCTVQLSGPWHA